MKYAFIVRHRDVSPTRVMCRAMNISASGFYEWFGRAASKHSQTDARLTCSIRRSFEPSDRTYGSPRVWHDLKAAGEQAVRRQPRCTPDEGGEPASQAQAPQASWRHREQAGEPHCTEPPAARSGRWSPTRSGCNFTDIWTAEGWLYAAAVMDLYSRRIVGWSMSDTMQARMVSDTLLMALWRRAKPAALIALMHHSDQGSQGGFNRSSQHLLIEGVATTG